VPLAARARTIDAPTTVRGSRGCGVSNAPNAGALQFPIRYDRKRSASTWRERCVPPLWPLRARISSGSRGMACSRLNSKQSKPHRENDWGQRRSAALYAFSAPEALPRASHRFFRISFDTRALLIGFRETLFGPCQNWRCLALLSGCILTLRLTLPPINPRRADVPGRSTRRPRRALGEVTE
jgi:hypothetical protein